MMPALLLATVLAADVGAAVGQAPVMTLDDVIRKAEANNPDLAILREKILQAEAGLSKAWSNVKPQLQAIGSYSRNSDVAEIPFADPRAGYTSMPMQSPPAPANSLLLIPNELTILELQPRDQYVGLLQASLPLIVMPAYYGIGAARRAVELTTATVEHARGELLFAMAQLYYGVYATSRVIELATKQLDAATEQERVAQSRYQAGELPKVGALRAGVERARAEQDLRRAENTHVAAKLALASLAGIEGDFTTIAPEVPAAPTDLESGLIDQALAERKDLAASHLGRELADKVVLATWWKLAPILAVNGQYRWTNFAGFTGKNESWVVTLNAIWTLYDGGLRYAELDEAQSKRREAELQVEKVRRQVALDVRTALLELGSARANLIKAGEQSRLANEGALLVDEQFKAGAATTLDVIDANNAKLGAGIAAVSEELNVQLAALKLAKAMGRLALGGTAAGTSGP